MHELPAAPGLYFMAGLACSVLGALCLIAAVIAHLFEE